MLRRRQLFPDDPKANGENDLGPMSLLGSDTDSPSAVVEPERCFDLSTDDYVILEEAQSPPKHPEYFRNTSIPPPNVAAAKSVVVAGDDFDSVSPLYLSPANQVVPKSPAKKSRPETVEKKAEGRARASLFSAPKAVYLCAKQGRGRKRLGQINAGVGHKIKRPKPRKGFATEVSRKGGISREQLEESDSALKASDASLSLIKSSSSVAAVSLSTAIQEFDRLESERPDSEPTGAGNKFFKHKRRVALMNVNKQLVARMPDGKMKLLEVDGSGGSSLRRHRIEREIQNDAANFPLSDYEQLVVPERIDRIIGALEDKENDSSGAPRAVTKSNEFVLPHKSGGPEAGEGLMSPTSQMCNMASGLVLNSPKRARQDLNSVLKDMPNAADNRGEFMTFLLLGTAYQQN